MTHIIAVVLTLAWVAGDLYLWHAIRSQELLLASSAATGAIYFVPFWFYITHEDRQRAS